MSDVYQQLAKHLDNLPAGYPPTETGVELRILKRLFTAEEAQIATGLTMMPESGEAIAARLGMPVESLNQRLEAMSRKGLIFRAEKGGRKHYMAAQFVIGIWEYHVNDLDPELIKDVNEYLPVLMKNGWVQRDTKQLRVIPVSKSVSAEMAVTPYEAAEEIIRSQSKIVLSPCICRREHKMVGKGCDRLMEACLSFGSGAFYYEQNGLGRSISQAEALEVLAKAQEQGLVLQPGNAQKPTNICMCCGCCCQILKNLKTLDSPAHAVHSNYFAQVTARECTVCGACADICQMDAIAVADTAEVNRGRCIGCGLCIDECPADAMKLIQKTDQDRYTPPNNVVETYMKIAQERGLF
jgi:electron transport complex protein RnfB